MRILDAWRSGQITRATYVGLLAEGYKASDIYTGVIISPEIPVTNYIAGTTTTSMECVMSAMTTNSQYQNVVVKNSSLTNSMNIKIEYNVEGIVHKIITDIVPANTICPFQTREICSDMLVYVQDGVASSHATYEIGIAIILEA